MRVLIIATIILTIADLALAQTTPAPTVAQLVSQGYEFKIFRREAVGQSAFWILQKGNQAAVCRVAGDAAEAQMGKAMGGRPCYAIE